MITIKKASENEISLIRELAKKSWNSAYSTILSQEQIDFMLSEMYSFDEIFNQMKNPNYHYFIIYFNENPAGFIGFENHYEPKTTKLHRIYLLDDFKGKGLGKTALSFLKERVTEIGDHRIILNVNKENSAKKMYESQGFTVYDEIILNIGNGFVMDDYLMEFKI